MSRTFSISSGSGDNLKVSLRWGRNPKACQIRLTVMRLRPVARASERVLQCVAPGGIVSNVVITACSTWSSVTVRGVPGRGSSNNPSNRSRAKRVRHLPTVAGNRRRRRVTVLLFCPAAQSITIRARRASCAAVRDRRATDSRCCCSAEALDRLEPVASTGRRARGRAHQLQGSHRMALE